MGPSSIWEASVIREPEPLDTGRQQLDGHCLPMLPRSSCGRRPSELALVAFVCVS